MKVLKKDHKYNWQFENIGGATRIKITSGKDIEHLPELDRKMWTVLSCPVKGLEIDDRSLYWIDTDSDGKIHLDDVIRTSKWIMDAVADTESLLHASGSFDILGFNKDSETGRKLHKSASCILKYLGKEGSVISMSDIADSSAIFSKTRFNGDGIITELSAEDPEEKEAITSALESIGNITDRSGAPGLDSSLIEKFYDALGAYSEWSASCPKAPFGAETEAVIAAYDSLDSKIKDFFLRSRLAGFSPECTSSLDVQKAQIEAVSPENLSDRTAEIASYPLARVTGKPEINLSGPVNPVWASAVETIREHAMPEGITVLTETIWTEIGLKAAEYKNWKKAKKGEEVEKLGAEKIARLVSANKKTALLSLVEHDLSLKEESDDIDLVDKFLHIYKDFYTLLKNFVSFQDFYNPDKNTRAIFQSGHLIIDQRCCHFCMDVADAAKHGVMAPASGIYLVYCDCVTKTRPGVRKIVAAVTVGDIGDLSVGKNAIFYDNSGLDWDAVVTKIIDNPISIAQAFWSPYRRMAKTVENFINKSAADKDAKIMAEASKKITEAPKIPATPADASAPVPSAAPPFDIAKFAGIFAAIGMALGMIGSFFVSLAKGFVALSWWQAILVIIGILLLISGPSMVMAWMKLRRRNIAPLLNANGWAVNASSNISIQFGATLTDIVKFPKIKIKDPYAGKKLPCWAKWLISLTAAAIVAVTLWLCNLLAWASLPSPLF